MLPLRPRSAQVHHRLVDHNDLHRASRCLGRHEDVSLWLSSSSARSFRQLLGHPLGKYPPGFSDGFLQHCSRSKRPNQLFSFDCPHIALRIRLAVTMRICEVIAISVASKSTKILSVPVKHLKGRLRSEDSALQEMPIFISIALESEPTYHAAQIAATSRHHHRLR